MKSYLFRILVSAPLARGGWRLVSGDSSGPAVAGGVLLLAASAALVLFDPLRLRRDRSGESEEPRPVRHWTEAVRYTPRGGGETYHVARCDGCAWQDGPFPTRAEAVAAARFHDPTRSPVELDLDR